jgi:dTDP-D-glucose 4,6-dehydratase
MRSVMRQHDVDTVAHFAAESHVDRSIQTNIKSELGWSQRVGFEEGLHRTEGWCLCRRKWAERICTGEYKKWIERNYGLREQ